MTAKMMLIAGRRTRREKAAEVERTIRAHWRSLSDREIAEMHGVSPTTVGKQRKILEAAGEILPRIETGQPMEACLKEVSISAIWPAPENDTLYDPIRQDDPAFLSLVEDIRTNGILSPIGVTADGYIYDGHRRYAAAKFLGMTRITVKVKPDASHAKDRDGFLRLLASCNKQRVKTASEVVREGVACMENATWQEVHEYRQEASQIDGAEVLILRGEKTRSEITQKLGLKIALVEIVNANRDDWPMSDRKIFYLALNVPGLQRNDVRKTPFENTPECYQDVTNMLTRLRLDGSIPFDCIGDETRPVIQWDTHRSVGTFVERETEDFLSGYARDLLQSQPNHVELLVEKNTVATCLERVAAKYTIPMTSGRGYSSLPPRKAMVDRFRASGREMLVLVVVSDFDPEGEDIPNAFGLSLRDDFGLHESRIRIIKAALTHDQTQTMELHEGQFAKEESARYSRFVGEFGNRCWELEAIPTSTLREIVEAKIRGLIDLSAFEHELQRQSEEREDLDCHRRQVRSMLGDMRWDSGGVA